MLGPELCCCYCETSAALFCSIEATPPRVSLQWHHTVPTVSASAHLHVMLLVSKLSQFTDSSARPSREQGEAKDGGRQQFSARVLPSVTGFLCLTFSLKNPHQLGCFCHWRRIS
ncbi:hypothetical protein CHARACLAT_007261 [Characodon lateralis]|uniref:Uncharacterized protein n=1 Tax=Characodon lateralis TaxID=208331 RepID=A0ABU7F198_9TELE|nr:hypothetical protein [Characodon lateralis]